MKTTLSVPRVVLLALALGTASITATYAQTPATAPTCTAGGRHHHDSVLTADEQAQLKKAHDAALAANPSLQTEDNTLKQQFETLKGAGKNGANKDQWKTLRAQRHDYEVKLHAAELAIDPTLAPIFAKLEAAHKNGHHHSA
jgi:hypothetical protein